MIRTIGNFPSCTPVGKLLTAFNLPYVYDYMCMQEAEVIPNHENERIRNTGKLKTDLENI
jgi:hypothetical protein